MTHAALEDLLKNWREASQGWSVLESGEAPSYWISACADELSAALSAMEGEAVAWEVSRADPAAFPDNRGPFVYYNNEFGRSMVGMARDNKDTVRPLIYGDTAPPPQQAEKCEMCGRIGPAPSEWVPYACKTCNRMPLIHPTPSPGPQGGGEALDAALIDAANLYADKYDAEDHADILNAFYRGAAWASRFATPPAQQPGEVVEAPGSYSWMAEVIRSAADYIQVVGSQNYHAHLRNIAAYIAALAPKEAGHDR